MHTLEAWQDNQEPTYKTYKPSGRVPRGQSAKATHRTQHQTLSVFTSQGISLTVLKYQDGPAPRIVVPDLKATVGRAGTGGNSTLCRPSQRPQTRPVKTGYTAVCERETAPDMHIYPCSLDQTPSDKTPIQLHHSSYTETVITCSQLPCLGATSRVV